jgi:hypothetical protein
MNLRSQISREFFWAVVLWILQEHSSRAHNMSIPIVKEWCSQLLKFTTDSPRRGLRSRKYSLHRGFWADFGRFDRLRADLVKLWIIWALFSAIWWFTCRFVNLEKGHPDQNIFLSTKTSGNPLHDSPSEMLPSLQEPAFDDESTHKPQRLNSIGDDSYYSYPNLFSSQDSFSRRADL